MLFAILQFQGFSARENRLAFKLQNEPEHPHRPEAPNIDVGSNNPVLVANRVIDKIGKKLGDKQKQMIVKQTLDANEVSRPAKSTRLQFSKEAAPPETAKEKPLDGKRQSHNVRNAPKFRAILDAKTDADFTKALNAYNSDSQLQESARNYLASVVSGINLGLDNAHSPFRVAAKDGKLVRKTVVTGVAGVEGEKITSKIENRSRIAPVGAADGERLNTLAAAKSEADFVAALEVFNAVVTVHVYPERIVDTVNSRLAGANSPFRVAVKNGTLVNEKWSRPTKAKR